MDDLSLKSVSSSDNISSEFEVVVTASNQEGLKIAGNGNEEDLKQNLKETMSGNHNVQTSSKVANSTSETSVMKTSDRPDSLEINNEDTPKQSPSFEEEDCILFSAVFYLGCASVNAPRSESEALRTISILRSQQSVGQNVHKSHDLPGENSPKQRRDSQQQFEVVLSVPNQADGNVRLLEADTSQVITSFKLYTILFCVRGQDNSEERDCFAFTESHQISGIFQCHVFRCDVPEAVRKVLYSFELAFRSIPKSPTTEKSTSVSIIKKRSSEDEQDVVNTSLSPGSHIVKDFDQNTFCFAISLEIKEDDSKGGFQTVPWDKTSSCFKLRKNLEKKVIVTVTQTTNVELNMERCFGLLLTPGRNVKQSDMHLLDMERSSLGEDPLTEGVHTVMGRWDPTHPHFQLLNNETQKGTRVFLSVAVDLVVQEVQEPVRFLIETKARVFPQTEKFWYFGKKILTENFFLLLNEIEYSKVSKKTYELVSVESDSTRSKNLGAFDYSVSRNLPHPNHALSSSSPQDEEDDDDTDEPLLSGSGEVNKECSQRVLSDWGEALNRWRANLSRRPTGLRTLIRAEGGVPDPLRGEVWQLLAGCHDNEHMLEQYRVLITKDSPQENIIQRDIHRTFPAHDFFKDQGGLGQDSLYRISKAYSVYDQEVGYCQGLSFLAAALLLHMPEEQAFCVLEKIMFKYKMRDLFKNGFEALHLKFYQLERLIADFMPNLYDHFKQLCIECHMFSSQWFLTLFTAKFPLNMVFQVVDVFLSEGELIVFKVALGLLECCRKELLALDFEGVLKYFRVQLPKKYRGDDHIKILIDTAVNIKITEKKLGRYEKDYEVVKEKLAMEEDPITRIDRENKRLIEANMRLELENDDIAQELVTYQITMETQLRRTMQHADDLQRDLTAAIGDLRTNREKVAETSDENQRLLVETKQVKEMCRTELTKLDAEIKAKTNIISDYKTICSQLSLKIESMQNTHKEQLEAARKESQNGSNAEPTSPDDVTLKHQQEKDQLLKQVRDLELQLAQTKLKLVESECKVQDVEHRLASTSRELQSTKNTWFHKTLNTLTTSKPAKGSGSNLPSPSTQTPPPFGVARPSTSNSDNSLPYVRQTVT